MRGLLFFCCLVYVLILFSFVFVSAEIAERKSKTLATTHTLSDEILCSSSPCEIGNTEIYYYHTEHLAYDFYSGCGDNFVCWTPIYDLAVSCLGLNDVNDFMIGFDAKPGFTFSDLDIYIDDQDVYFDLDDWKWYRYEEDVLLFSYLPAENVSLDWDFYLTDYAVISDYKYFLPEKYLPNPDISCYFNCYQIYEEPFCYCENSQKYECDAYGDLYSYYIDFEAEKGYWAIKNVYFYPLHDSGLYETLLIKFLNMSQVESARLVFDVTGDNPDALYEQGNFYIEGYDAQDNELGTILDEVITGSVTKNIDVKQFLREDGIKFLFGNDVASRYVIKNIRIEFVVRILKGDVNGDCKVNIFDLAKVGLCYGCLSTQECWQNCKQADIKEDNKIDIFDLATVGLNYGESC